jgi:fructose-specific phosphotransferase system IIC component
MIHQIALTTFLGLPLVAYGGIVTFLSFLFTASIGYANYHGYKWIPFKWHPRMVLLSFIIASFHAFIALSIFLNY